MVRKALLIMLLMIAGVAAVALPQVRRFSPVTTEMLEKPSPDDWLMYSRTYDAQRYSPLNQIKKQNVGQLKLAWSKDMATGPQESIPLVHDGVMYMISTGPAGGPAGPYVWALDATNGNVLWEYKRPTGGTVNSKAIAMFEDMLYYPAGDTIVALDALTGKVRWETVAAQGGRLSSGFVMAGDKVISGRTCGGNPRQASCYIAAHDARTGKELWRFYTAAGADDPVGDKSWGGAPVADRSASTWGLTGSYDPVKKIIYWGVANPTPNTRAARHGGNSNAIGMSAPADLYSNSTVALNPENGKLLWYYQHLPGDDWDQDYTNERILLRTAVNPDPKFVKWFNPDVQRNQPRDVAVNIGEGGGLFVLDRDTGQFLWATPFPYDTPEFLISNIDGKTGRSTINWDVVLKQPGEHHVICAYNTKSYWPMSYHPGKNSMYIPYVDNCLDMTAAAPASGDKAATPERRGAVRRPGSDPEKFGGLAKVNMSTGEIQRIYEGRAPGVAATLTTAGDVVFWGDLNRKFRAFDTDTGKILWETTLEGPVSNSTVTYAVNGKQYIAVLVGNGGLQAGLMRQSGIEPKPYPNGIYVFSLP